MVATVATQVLADAIPALADAIPVLATDTLATFLPDPVCAAPALPAHFLVHAVHFRIILAAVTASIQEIFFLTPSAELLPFLTHQALL